MANGLIINPEEYALEFKVELVGEISKTALGRNLLAWMEKNDVGLVISPDMSAVDGNGNQAGGYWNPETRKIYLNPALGVSHLLHVFAHELRHAAQEESRAAFRKEVEILFPANQMYLTRLDEMDGDVFAVFFVAQHLMKARPDKDLVKLVTSQSNGAYETRPDMYIAFAVTWQENKNESAETRATLSMQAAMEAYFDDKNLAKLYSNYALDIWKNNMYPVIEANIGKPGTPFSKAFARVAARYAEGKLTPPLERLKRLTPAFGKLFNAEGAPDFYATARQESLARIETPVARLAAAEKTFRNAAREFLPKGP